MTTLKRQRGLRSTFPSRVRDTRRLTRRERRRDRLRRLLPSWPRRPSHRIHRLLTPCRSRLTLLALGQAFFKGMRATCALLLLASVACVPQSKPTTNGLQPDSQPAPDIGHVVAKMGFKSDGDRCEWDGQCHSGSCAHGDGTKDENNICCTSDPRGKGRDTWNNWDTLSTVQQW